MFFKTKAILFLVAGTLLFTGCAKENSIGRRDAYTREKSVFYMVDRESGEVVTSYEF